LKKTKGVFFFSTDYIISHLQKFKGNFFDDNHTIDYENWAVEYQIVSDEEDFEKVYAVKLFFLSSFD
jgi:hypothetical protein